MKNAKIVFLSISETSDEFKKICDLEFEIKYSYDSINRKWEKSNNGYLFEYKNSEAEILYILKDSTDNIRAESKDNALMQFAKLILNKIKDAKIKMLVHSSKPIFIEGIIVKTYRTFLEDPLWEKLIKPLIIQPLLKRTNLNFDKIFAEPFDFELRMNLLSLRDRINSIFLPILFDLNSLQDLSIKAPYYQREKALKELLIDILKEKESQYYTKKLTEARFMGFGKDFGVLDEHLKKFKDANLKETLLKFPEMRKVLLEIFGYRAESEIGKLEDYERNLKEDSNFMVSEFFNELDTLIDKCNKPEGISYDNVSKILAYYERFLNWFKRMNLSFLKLFSILTNG